MKKRIILILISALIFIGLVGCDSTVTKTGSIESLEGIGTITQDPKIHDNIVKRFSKDSNFMPVKYENGIVKGIILPAVTSDYYSSFNVEAIYNENFPYIYKMYSIKDGEIIEIDEKYDLSKVIETESIIENGKLIIKKDNDILYEYDPVKDFKLKVYDKYVHEEIDSKGNWVEKVNVEYRDEKGEGVYIDTNQTKIDSRYISVSLYCNEKGKQFIVDQIENKVYELPNKTQGVYADFRNNIIAYKDELYLSQSNGEIYKLLLSENKATKEKIVKIDLEKDEFLASMTSYIQANDKGNLFLTINKRLGDNSYSNIKDIVVNLDSRGITELGNININSRSFTIDYVFENNDFVVIDESNSNKNIRWIGKYDNGKIQKLQMIENGDKVYSYTDYEVQSIIYDEKTNTFFLRRKLHEKGKGIYYSYEYLTIN